MKKAGCKKGEIKFKGRCYPKTMKQSEHTVLDWDIEYGFKGNKVIMKNIEGCVTDSTHVHGKCSVGAIIRKKEALAKTINNLLKKYVRKIEDFKIPDKQWKSRYKYDDKGGSIERKDFIEHIKVGNTKYAADRFFCLLNEVLDQAIVTKSKSLAKKLIGEKVKITYWQDKTPDGPIIFEGDGGFYALAPVIVK